MRPIYRQPLVIFCSLALVTLFSYQLIFQQLLKQSQQLSLQHGVEFNQYLNLQLTRFSTLTDTLVKRPELKQLLENPPVPAQQIAVSQLLADFTLASGSASVYLMDPEGLVVASSNYADPVSFMDYNFGFRPYFPTAYEKSQSDFPLPAIRPKQLSRH